MAKNISLLGADYPDVPAVQLPQTGGGTATFYDLPEIFRYNGVMGSTDYPSKNFNDYTTEGTYYNGGTNNGFTNVPTSSPDNGYLIVSGGSGCNQIWIGRYAGALCIRHKVSGSWTTWKSLY